MEKAVIRYATARTVGVVITSQENVSVRQGSVVSDVKMAAHPVSMGLTVIDSVLKSAPVDSVTERSASVNVSRATLVWHASTGALLTPGDQTVENRELDISHICLYNFWEY